MKIAATTTVWLKMLDLKEEKKKAKIKNLEKFFFFKKQQIYLYESMHKTYY